MAFDKLASLELAEYQPGFDVEDRFQGWQRLTLTNVVYRYTPSSGGEGFQVGPLNLTLARGEQVFLIGGNGSGKSTLARLLSVATKPGATALTLMRQGANSRAQHLVSPEIADLAAE